MPYGSAQTVTYTTFGGCDIRAVFRNQVMFTLQGVSYSVTREKAPVYTMGSTDPISISRGKRGTAGSLIFLTIDRHALYDFMARTDNQYSKKPNDLAMNQTSTSYDLDNTAAETVLTVAPTAPNYPDQIPPFDITLAAVNEAGSTMAMRIVGVEIISNGSGVSVDDLNIEEQMTFICRGIIPWGPTSDLRES